MTKHRAPRRRRRRALLLALLLVAGIVAWVVPSWHPAGRYPRPIRAVRSIAPDRAPALRPTERAAPEYLATSYRAPPALVRPGAGTLRIPSLGIRAPVDAVGLDGTAMAVPDEPARVGWLRSSASNRDLVGSSVLAGHVSDPRDHPGALAPLGQIVLGARIIWTDPGGKAYAYRVIRIQRFPRSSGLPASMFDTGGRHRLRLVTCAERVGSAGGGFHYRSNLVVTAAARSRQTARGSKG